ncbi:MAG TPA: radical SAM protein [Blastocatellia bacterium]|nr:radical SAM protein [Blastocatellia bacterium]
MRLKRKIISRIREFKFLAKGLVSTRHPILAHLIPLRRCNLSCSYCNEYDDYSPPLPTEVLFSRIDRLAEFGAGAVTFSGGEPLLHPELERVISRVRKHGMLAGLITNGYLLTRERIRTLNDAGLEYLQISIDNVLPDESSKKSLKVLDKKLVWLSELAEFRVNINSVIGSGIKNPEDALVVARRAVELGLTCSLGIIHDGKGILKPLNPKEREVYAEMKGLGKKSYSRVMYFKDNLVEGKPNNWRCRAGARYLYICEDGLVHYCSQRRGYPGIPLEQYTREDMRREYLTKKPCAAYCTIACVHQVATFDFWRDPQSINAGRRRPVQIQPIRQPLQASRADDE